MTIGERFLISWGIGLCAGDCGKGVGPDAMQFQGLGAILDWLTTRLDFMRNNCALMMRN